MRKWYKGVKSAKRDVFKPYHLSFSIAIAWEAGTNAPYMLIIEFSSQKECSRIRGKLGFLLGMLDIA